MEQIDAKMFYVQTAEQINKLLEWNDNLSVIMICKLHSVSYMLEVYKLLSKENKNKLLALISK